MRTAVPLLLILAGCLAVCGVLSLYHRSLPGLVSGQVIDWQTGQPASDIEVRAGELNFSHVVARSDVHGQFRFQPQDPPRAYFLFASSAHYGRLLQATWGQTVVLYRKGQQVRDVVIPAIPATELSGHVYGSDGQPIAGCYVSALTRASHFDPSTDLQRQGVHTITPFDLAQADDPNQWMDVESVKTDGSGFYVLHHLGADRYFVFTRCQEAQTPRQNPPFIWEPMLYPNVNSIAGAQQILLLPGDHRAGIDFHMQRKRAYALEGKIVFSDHSVPKRWPEAIYSQDLLVLRSDRSLTSTGLGQESCRTTANAGTFRCDALLPGDYTLYFEVSPGLGAASDIPSQAAIVRYHVPVKAKRAVTVELHEVPDGGVRYQRPYAGPGGTLDFGKVCATARDGRPAIQVLAWGQDRTGGACYYKTVEGTTWLRLPRGLYRVNAFEAAFHTYSGDSTKVENVVMQHGSRIELKMGQTLKPTLPVLTTKQLINFALASLKEAR